MFGRLDRDDRLEAIGVMQRQLQCNIAAKDEPMKIGCFSSSASQKATINFM